MTAKDSDPEPAGGAQSGRDQVAVGWVVRPHGVRGAVLVKPISEVFKMVQPGGVVYLGDERRSVTIASVRSHRHGHLVQFKEVSDRGQAETLRQASIFLGAEDAGPLPDGVYYHWQIIGLDVVTEEGERLGSVAQIIETGANDVYVVRGHEGGEILLPAIRSVVQEVLLDERLIRVKLLPGLRGGGEEA